MSYNHRNKVKNVRAHHTLQDLTKVNDKCLGFFICPFKLLSNDSLSHPTLLQGSVDNGTNGRSQVHRDLKSK